MISIVLRRFLARTMTKVVKKKADKILRQATQKKDEIVKKVKDHIQKHVEKRRKAAQEAFNQGVKKAKEQATRLKEQVKQEVKNALKRGLGKERYEAGALVSAAISVALKKALKKAIRSSAARVAKEILDEIIQELRALLAVAFSKVQAYFSHKFNQAVEAATAWTAEKINEWVDYAWSCLPEPVQRTYTTIKRFFTVKDNPDVKRDELASLTKTYIEEKIGNSSVECDKFVDDITSQANNINNGTDGHVKRTPYSLSSIPFSLKARALSKPGLIVALMPQMHMMHMAAQSAANIENVEKIAHPIDTGIDQMMQESDTQLTQWNNEEQGWWQQRGPFHSLTGREFQDVIKGSASVAAEYASPIGVTIAGLALMNGFNKILSSTFAQCKAAKELYNRAVLQIAEKIMLPPELSEMTSTISEAVAILEKHIEEVLNKIEDIFEVDLEKLFEDISSIFFGFAEAFAEVLGLNNIQEMIETELRNTLSLISEKIDSVKMFSAKVKEQIHYVANISVMADKALGTLNVISYVYKAFEEEKAAPAALQRWYQKTHKRFNKEHNSKSAERLQRLEDCANELRANNSNNWQSLQLINQAKIKLATMENKIKNFWNAKLEAKASEYNSRRGYFDQWSRGWLDTFKVFQAGLMAVIIWELALLTFPYALAISVATMAAYPTLKTLTEPVRQHVSSHSTAYKVLGLGLTAITGALCAWSYMGRSEN